MDMSVYEADTAWNQGIPCIFFQKLIQLYLLCLFIYYYMLLFYVYPQCDQQAKKLFKPLMAESTNVLP